MRQIRIAGVPEHFNLPWHIAQEKQLFAQENLDIVWQDVPEGTGKLCQMLRNEETDLAVILTEGIIKDILAGNDSSIIQIYVESPLIWGIHVAARSQYDSISDLENTKAAISRYGSGSQLMAYVNAKNNHWNLENLQFEVVNTLDGAVTALSEGTADYFMWERFMTKPLVDKGVFRLVGTCPTPWPCFVIAVRNEFLEQNKNAVTKLLKTINLVTKNFKQIEDIDQILADRYHQKLEDIQEWLSLTEWSQRNFLETEFETIQNQLLELKIIDKKGTFANTIKTISF